MTKNVEIKEKILSILLENPRKSFRNIAGELNISPTTVIKIIKSLEEEGIIIGYTTLIDWQKCGYDSTLCLQITVTPNADIDKVGKALSNLEYIKQVFYTTGNTTFAAYAVCKDSNEAVLTLKELRSIPGVERVESHTVLKMF